MADSVVYNGHLVGKERVRPTEEKVKAVQEAPEPENTMELRRYFALINCFWP